MSYLRTVIIPAPAIALLIFLLVITYGCTVTPDYQTGDNCWRYKVAENNTGRMTHYDDVMDIPVIGGLSAEELMWACDTEILSWGCYHTLDDAIYLMRGAGAITLREERCHAAFGRKHNSCDGYGIGDSEADCGWKARQ